MRKNKLQQLDRDLGCGIIATHYPVTIDELREALKIQETEEKENAVSNETHVLGGS